MDNIAVTPFQFQENITLRTVSLEGEHWFVAKDVAEALGYANTKDAISRHCKGDAKRYPLRTTGGTQEFRIIREPDLYRLIVGSTLPAAQEFEAWIFEEVLPTLRRTGNYAIPPKSAAYARRVEAARPGPEWHTMREIATAWNMDRRSAALRITRMQRWGEVEIRASESRWQPYQAARKAPPFRAGRESANPLAFFLAFAYFLPPAAGHAVSACGEMVRPGGIRGWFATVKFPTLGNLAAKTKPCSSGQSR